LSALGRNPCHITSQYDWILGQPVGPLVVTMNSDDNSTGLFNSSFTRFDDAAFNRTTDRAHTAAPPANSTPTFWTPINTTYVIIGLTGVAGNLFSCVVIISYQPLRKRLTNYFIVNQCFLDLVTAFALALNAGLEYILRTATGASLYAACYLIYTRIFFTSVFAASIWNLAALAVERYLKIVHAVRHKTSVTKTKIVGACVAVWIFGFAYRGTATLPVVLVKDGACYVTWFRSPAAKLVFGCGIFLGDFFLPLSAIAFCYVQIMRKLRKINATSAASSSATKGVRRNIIRLLLGVSVAFLVTVGPRQLLVFYLNVTQQPLNITSLSYLISLCFNYINCSINPFIYLFKYDDFRRGTMKLLGIGGKLDDGNSGGDSAYDGNRAKTSMALNKMQSRQPNDSKQNSSNITR
jgi:7 transmembrane receptor (rhodopsin family)